MLIINSNKINLVTGNGKCKCYDQGGISANHELAEFNDSEKCYQHCCLGMYSDSYEYISKGLSFLHMCNETLEVRFNKNAEILRGAYKVSFV